MDLKSKENTPKGKHLKICYESTYLGYSLQRDLSSKGIQYEIIAPTSIPKFVNQKVKTDRVDAAHLAKNYQKDQLTIIDIPSEEESVCIRALDAK